MESNEITEQIKLRNKRYIIIALAFMSFNTLLYAYLIRAYSTFEQTLITVFQVNFFILTIFGFLFGFLVACLPFRGLGFRKKYLRASLFSILVVQGIEAVGLILVAILKWGLHYPIG